MKLLPLILICACQGFADQPDLEDFKNKFAVGLDSRVKYERLLPHGFQIGTEWRYRIVVEGRKNLHADQQPEFWLLTASHCLSLKFADWENRISALGGDIDFTEARFVSRIKKQIVFDQRWALSPFVEVLDYYFDGSALDAEWPYSRNAHHLEFDTQLGLDLEIHF